MVVCVSSRIGVRVLLLRVLSVLNAEVWKCVLWVCGCMGGIPHKVTIGKD